MKRTYAHTDPAAAERRDWFDKRPAGAAARSMSDEYEARLAAAIEHGDRVKRVWLERRDARRLERVRAGVTGGAGARPAPTAVLRAP